MLAFQGHIYQSVRLEIPPDRTERGEAFTIPVLHLINPPGAIPQVEPEDEAGAGLPIYEEGEPTAGVRTTSTCRQPTARCGRPQGRSTPPAS